MKERPILFSAPMVRAILAGAKTQTRRVVTEPRWAAPGSLEGDADGLSAVARVSGCLADVDCPYGAPGDRLYVRETWRTEERAADLVDGIRFAADDVFVPIADTREAADRWVAAHHRRIKGAVVRADPAQWRPAIHLPRWASRLSLDVTAVRVERLQAISEGDARAEGVQSDADALAGLGHLRGADAARAVPSRLRSARDHFRALWDAINGERAAWASNPWVFVISFRRVPS